MHYLSVGDGGRAIIFAFTLTVVSTVAGIAAPPTPRQEAPGGGQLDLDSVRLYQNYTQARRQILAMGLQPAPLPRGGKFDQCQDKAICRQFPEVVGCSGTGLNLCRIAFIAPDGRIVVATTSGETPAGLNLNSLSWADATGSKRIRNVMARKPEFADLAPHAETGSNDDVIAKLPIMASELSSVIVISISGVRGKPLPFREWLEGVSRNPNVEKVSAGRVWIDSILPYLVVYVKIREGKGTFGFAFDRQEEELFPRFFQTDGEYHKISTMALGEQMSFAQLLIGLPK